MSVGDILKDDVQTYVRALIEKEFESNLADEKGFSQNRSFNTKDRQNEKDRHACDHALGDARGE